MGHTHAGGPRRAIGASTVFLLFVIAILAVSLAYNYTSTSYQISSLNAAIASDNNNTAFYENLIQQFCGNAQFAATAQGLKYCPRPPPASFPVGTIILYRTMPQQFTVGNYTFHMEYNGTGYPIATGGTTTTFDGLSLVFKISNGNNANQTVIFRWSTPAPASGALPSPQVATINGGPELVWFGNQTGTYLNVVTG